MEFQQRNKSESVTTIREYKPLADQPDHIGLKEGDLVVVHRKDHTTGLWYGEKAQGEHETGWFPASHVTPVLQQQGKVQRTVARLSRPLSSLLQRVTRKSNLTESQSRSSTSSMRKQQKLQNRKSASNPLHQNMIEELKQIQQLNKVSQVKNSLDFKTTPIAEEPTIDKPKKMDIIKEDDNSNAVNSSFSFVNSKSALEQAFGIRSHVHPKVNQLVVQAIAQYNEAQEAVVKAENGNFEDEPIYANSSELEQQQPQEPITEYVIAIESYQIARTGDLAIEVNDRIRILSRQYPDWWRGRNVRTGAIGLFPSKAVRPLKHSDKSSTAEARQEVCAHTSDDASTVSSSYCDEDEIYENNQIYSNNDAMIYDANRKMEKSSKSTELKYMEMTSVQLAAMMLHTVQTNGSGVDGDEELEAELSYGRRPVSSSDYSSRHSSYKDSELRVATLPSHQVSNKSQKPYTADAAEKTLSSLVERFKRIHELVDTERKYLEEVNFVLQKFKAPLEKNIPMHDCEPLLQTLRQIHTLHQTFYREMTRQFQCESGLYNPCIGGLVRSHLEKLLPPYKALCAANRTVTSKLETTPQLVEQLETIVQTEGEQFKLPFRMFFSRPMQRITRYPMLLQSLLKSTPPIHPDQRECQKALEVVMSLCTEVNKQMDPEQGKREQKVRANIREALLQFQNDYTTNFTFALTNYILPIQSAGLIEDGNLFFINYQQIYLINISLLDKVIRRFESQAGGGELADDHCTGSILLEHYQKMQSVYQSFALGYIEVVAKIENDPNLSGRFERMFSVRCRGSSLAFKCGLLRSMQQFIKLPLIIDEMLRIAPAGHQCHNTCAQDLNMAQSFCKEISNALDVTCQRWEWSELKKLYWIQRHILVRSDLEFKIDITQTALLGPRVLLHSGILFTANQSSTLIAFLFNDFLLLAEASKRPQNIPCGAALFDSAEINSMSYTLECRPVLLDDFHIEQPKETELDFATSRQFRLEMHSQKRCLSLRANSLDEWAGWLEAIAIAKHNYESYLNCVQAKVSEVYPALPGATKQLIAMITLSQIEVIHLYNPNYTLNVYCKVSIGKNWSAARPVWTSTTVAMDKHFNPNRKVTWEYNDLIEVYHKSDLLLFRCYEVNPYGPHQCLGEAVQPIEEVRKFKHNLKDITKGLHLKSIDSSTTTTASATTKLPQQATSNNNNAAVLRVTFNVQ